MAANDYDPYGTNDNGDNNSGIDPNTGLPYGQQPAPPDPVVPDPGPGRTGPPQARVGAAPVTPDASDRGWDRNRQINPVAPTPTPDPPAWQGTGYTPQQGPYYPATMLQQDPRFSDLVNTLMTRAKGSLDINPLTDPIIRPQVDNYGATQTRMARQAIDSAAEAGSPYATGSQQTARTQANEQAGFNTSNLQSSLMTNELTARRKDITDALQESGQLLTADQQMKLQEELGLIDANLKQQGLNSQNDQFLANFGLNQNNQNQYWDAVKKGLL